MFPRVLCLREAPYAASDAVCGVKVSLLIDLVEVDGNTAMTYDVNSGKQNDPVRTVSSSPKKRQMIRETRDRRERWQIWAEKARC